MIERKTILSENRVYRYTLWRDWSDLFRNSETGNKFAMFIGLNPSTADETLDDPTIRRCVGFAKRWGYGALCMTNLFAYRTKDPRAMKKVTAPVGEENNDWLLRVAGEAGIIIAAWGVHGTFLNRDTSVRLLLAEHKEKMRVLRFTNGAHPEHPLYVPGNIIPQPFS